MEQHSIKGTSVKFATGPDEQLFLVTTATIEELKKLRKNSIVSADLVASLLGGTDGDYVTNEVFTLFSKTVNDRITENTTSINKLKADKAEKTALAALEARIAALENA